MFYSTKEAFKRIKSFENVASLRMNTNPCMAFVLHDLKVRSLEGSKDRVTVTYPGVTVIKVKV